MLGEIAEFIYIYNIFYVDFKIVAVLRAFYIVSGFL